MSSPPPVTTPPGSNVTPMWGGSWPGRPPASPPSCFSQLYGLNQCYDDIIMMQQILMKVICDMSANNPAFQKCLAEGVAAAGAGAPLTGVTDGSNAAPGIVGEYIHWTPSGTYPTGTSTVLVTPGTLQPGDWDLNGIVGVGGAVDSFSTSLVPQPTGVDWNMAAYIILANPPGAGDLFILPLVQARASITVPTLFSWTQTVNAGTNAGAAYQYVISARRRR